MIHSHLVFADTLPLSDLEWQERFAVMRQLTKQAESSAVVFPSGNNTSPEYYYHLFIYDILKNIRRGRVDYRYFVYQIAELLKYEKERLRSRYFPDGKFFAVWLGGNK